MTAIDPDARAQLLLEQLDSAGLSPEDLIAARDGGALPDSHRAPTVAEYVPVVAALYDNAGTAATYAPGWRALVERHGDRRLDEVTASQVAALAKDHGSRGCRYRGALGILPEGPEGADRGGVGRYGEQVDGEERDDRQGEDPIQQGGRP